jgi:hypothetical protein
MNPSKLNRGNLEENAKSHDKTYYPTTQHTQSWEEREAALMLTCLSDKGNGSTPMGGNTDDSAGIEARVTRTGTEVSSSNVGDQTSSMAVTAAQNVSLGELAASIAAHHGIMPLQAQSSTTTVSAPEGNGLGPGQNDGVNNGGSKASPYNDQPVSRGAFAKTFPEKLHDMLDSEDERDSDDQGDSSALSWLPNGRSFVIRNRHKLVADILPRHNFQKCKKFGSFTRRLYLWGFRKIANSPGASAFHHELFQRGNRMSCLHMQCRRSTDVPFNSATPDSKLPARPQHEPHVPVRKATESSTSEGITNAPAPIGTSRRGSSEYEEDDDCDFDEDENDDDEDYYDRHPLYTKENGITPVEVGDGGGGLQVRFAKDNMKTSKAVSDCPAPVKVNDDGSPLQQHTVPSLSISLSSDGTVYPPGIQALVDQVDMSTLSLHSLLGVNHAADESPAMMHLYQAASKNSFDRDALTEWLLFHHQKKLFLRTALLSEMVRTLTARKTANATQQVASQQSQPEPSCSKPLAHSSHPRTQPNQHQPLHDVRRHSKQPKLQHNVAISSALSQTTPKQPHGRKSNAKEKSAASSSRKKESKRSNGATASPAVPAKKAS